jgi:hypothetical protein
VLVRISQRAGVMANYRLSVRREHCNRLGRGGGDVKTSLTAFVCFAGCAAGYSARWRDAIENTEGARTDRIGEY